MKKRHPLTNRINLKSMMNERCDETNQKIPLERVYNTLSGILLLDKPVGITSNGALQHVKRLLKVKKAGHTGSLDPLASGMLPLCIGGEATKFSSYLLNADKRYEVWAQLGVRTTTGDAEGEVIAERPVEPFALQSVESILSTFVGEIDQIPPMFSAIKQNGRPLYELARQGIIVEREKRQVHIYDLSLLEIRADQLLLAVHCSKGTYVRTLVEDIGEALGCGAYVSGLRRTTVGGYSQSQMIPLADLETAISSQSTIDLKTFLLPISSCLDHFPSVIVNANLLFYLCRGQPVRIQGAPAEGWVRLLNAKDDFLGVGEALEDGRIAPRRLLGK
jgi:tRNA pseudouridine55 synthase